MGRVFYIYYFIEVIVSGRGPRIFYTFRRHFSLTRNQKHLKTAEKNRKKNKKTSILVSGDYVVLLDGKQQHFINE